MQHLRTWISCAIWRRWCVPYGYVADDGLDRVVGSQIGVLVADGLLDWWFPKTTPKGVIAGLPAKIWFLVITATSCLQVRPYGLTSESSIPRSGNFVSFCSHVWRSPLRAYVSRKPLGFPPISRGRLKQFLQKLYAQGCRKGFQPYTCVRAFRWPLFNEYHLKVVILVCCQNRPKLNGSLLGGFGNPTGIGKSLVYVRYARVTRIRTLMTIKRVRARMRGFRLNSGVCDQTPVRSQKGSKMGSLSRTGHSLIMCAKWRTRFAD